MPTLTEINGFQHRSTDVAQAGSGFIGMFDTVQNVSGFSFDTSVKRSVDHLCSLKLIQDNVNTINLQRTIATQTFVFSFYIRLAAAPASSSRIFVVTGGTQGAVVRVETDGKINVGFNTGTFRASAGSVADGNWHRIDGKIVTSATTYTFDCQVDGVALTQATIGTVSILNMVSYWVGANSAGNIATIWFSDLVASVTSGDYPLGLHMVLPRNPSGDGTHVLGTTNAIKGDANETTNLWQKVDDWLTGVADLTTYLQYSSTTTGDAASNYAEIAMQDITGSAIWDVVLEFAGFAAGTGADSVSVRAVNAAGTTIDTATIDFSGSASALGYHRDMMTRPASGWDTDFNGTKVRWGLATDTNAIPFLSAVMFEVAVARDDSSITPTRVAAIAAVPTPTVAATAAVTPTTVSGVASVPTPTIAVSASITPTTVAAVTSVPTPTVAATAAVTPTTVAAVASVPTPTVVAQTDASVTPTTVSRAVAIATPALALDVERSPPTVAALTSIPTPTVETVAPDASVTPSPVLATSAVPSPIVTVDVELVSTPNSDDPSTRGFAAVPTPTVAATAAVTTATVQAVASIPTPSVAATAAVTTTTVTATAAIPTPTVAAVTPVTPSTVTAVASIPTPTVAATAAVTPTTVSRAAAIASPTVVATATVTPTTATATTSIPTPTVAVTAAVTTTTVLATTSIPTPTVTVAAAVTPTTVAAVAAVPTPTVAATAAVTPTTVARSVLIPTPSIQVGGNVSIETSPVLATAAVPTPTVVATANASITTTTVAAVAAIATPTVVTTSNASVTPTTVTRSVAIPTPTVDASANTSVAPSSVQATVTIATPGVIGGADIAITTTTVAVGAEIPTPQIDAEVNATPATVAATASVPVPLIDALVIIPITGITTVGATAPTRTTTNGGVSTTTRATGDSTETHARD